MVKIIMHGCVLPSTYRGEVAVRGYEMLILPTTYYNVQLWKSEEAQLKGE